MLGRSNECGSQLKFKECVIPSHKPPLQISLARALLRENEGNKSSKFINSHLPILSDHNSPTHYYRRIYLTIVEYKSPSDPLYLLQFIPNRTSYLTNSSLKYTISHTFAISPHFFVNTIPLVYP